MYHRNKVHTDEFWKYELSKGSGHRGNRLGSSALDPRQNDELWQRQINGGSAKSSTLGAPNNKGTNTQIGKLVYSLDFVRQNRLKLV